MADLQTQVRALLAVPDTVQAPESLTQTNARLRFVADAVGKLPKDQVGRGRTAQWLSFSRYLRGATADTRGSAEHALAALNDELRTNVFVVGASPTLADAVLFVSLKLYAEKFPDAAATTLPKLTSVARWQSLYAASAKQQPVFAAPAGRSLEESKAAGAVALPAAVAATFGAGGAPTLPAAAGGAKGQQQQKQQKNKKKGGKKKKPAAAPAAAPAAEPIAEIDIRVGQIVKVWEHPDSDKLWCESIDCGEEKPRQILSGLRHNFTQEQMLRRVLVVCNLKAAKLGGIPSHGMVLCASNDEHTEVEFLEPPEGAKIG